MQKKTENTDTLKKSFLVRLLDIETIELLQEAETINSTLSRNAIVNECIKNWLPIMLEKQNPTIGLQRVFTQEMSDYDNKIKKELNSIKTLLLILSATQIVSEKGIGYIINQLDNALSKQNTIAPLPNYEVELGSYDHLPKRLQNEKDIAITSIIESGD
jgi:hypothetical protein